MQCRETAVQVLSWVLLLGGPLSFWVQQRTGRQMRYGRYADPRERCVANTRLVWMVQELPSLLVPLLLLLPATETRAGPGQVLLLGAFCLHYFHRLSCASRGTNGPIEFGSGWEGSEQQDLARPGPGLGGGQQQQQRDQQGGQLLDHPDQPGVGHAALPGVRVAPVPHLSAGSLLHPEAQRATQEQDPTQDLDRSLPALHRALEDRYHRLCEEREGSLASAHSLHWESMASTSMYQCVFVNTEGTKGWSNHACHQFFPYICEMKTSC
ncbi:hypothetical protein CRUP_020101 [Coryphaenoides rupestris]|nr:hypothetical protein CRUP_020101 [Coryphaenoides rupestris]